MFAGLASLARPDRSVLAAVPVELDMDLPPPDGSLPQPSALSQEGTLTPAEASMSQWLIDRHQRLQQRLRSEMQGSRNNETPAAQDQQVPTEELVLKSAAGGA
jgi:hypothetical protein